MAYILASASPRRKELLKLVIKDFIIIPSDIDEIVPEGLKCEEQPEYLARIKAQSISSDYKNDIVIGADTSVIVDDIILGKPKNAEDAKRMLMMLSGRKHKVTTGCAVCKSGVMSSFSETTEVEFYKLSNEEINSYIATGEPFDKAGSYGIQHYGALLVKAVYGDYFNVVGLPVAHLKRFLQL